MKKYVYQVTEGSEITRKIPYAEVLSDAMMQGREAVEFAVDQVDELNGFVEFAGITADHKMTAAIEYFIPESYLPMVDDYRNINSKVIVKTYVRVTFLPKIEGMSIEQWLPEQNIEYILDHDYVVDYDRFVEDLEENDLEVSTKTLAELADNKKYVVDIKSKELKLK